MLQAKEALERVLGTVPPLGVERIPLSVCLGRVLAEEVFARMGPRPSGGSALLCRGVRLGPLEIARLASRGVAETTAALRPRLALLSTGSELISVAQPAVPGKTWDSNGPSLAAAGEVAGVQAVDYGIVPDDVEKLLAIATHAAGRSDILLVSGGVSRGDQDTTCQALDRLGTRTVFHGVAIKPGQSLLFGMCGSTAVFGLPGDPMSAWVCFEEFVRPAIEKMQGAEPRDLWTHVGKAAGAFTPGDELQHYLFCRSRREDRGYELEILFPRSFPDIAAAVRADALAVVPAGTTQVRPGDELRFRWIV